MAQVTIYLEDDVVDKMKKAAKESSVSQSKWVSNLIRSKVNSQWPKSVTELAGSWGDFPNPEELRIDLGEDSRRESF
jgi:hypothetical protein